MNNSFHELLKSSPLIAILRGITPEETPTVCDVLYEAGIRLLEIPLNSPQACRSIAIAVAHCGKRQIVGAGTVLSPENVHCVHLAGGEFIISPNTNQEVIRTTKKLNMISI